MLRTGSVMTVGSLASSPYTVDQCHSHDSVHHVASSQRRGLFTLLPLSRGVAFTAHALLGEGQTNQNFLELPTSALEARALRMVLRVTALTRPRSPEGRVSLPPVMSAQMRARNWHGD